MEQEFTCRTAIRTRMYKALSELFLNSLMVAKTERMRQEKTKRKLKEKKKTKMFISIGLLLGFFKLYYLSLVLIVHIILGNRGFEMQIFAINRMTFFIKKITIWVAAAH